MSKKFKQKHDSSDTQMHKYTHTHTNILLTSMIRLLNYSKQLAKCVNLDMLVLLVYCISYQAYLSICMARVLPMKVYLILCNK